jgi:hypothetical protein
MMFVVDEGDNDMVGVVVVVVVENSFSVSMGDARVSCSKTTRFTAGCLRKRVQACSAAESVNICLEPSRLRRATIHSFNNDAAEEESGREFKLR